MINSSRDQNKQKTSFYSQSAQQDAEDSANLPKWNCPARAGHQPTESDKCEPESNTKSSVAP